MTSKKQVSRIVKIILIFSAFVALGFGVGYLMGIIIKANMNVSHWWYILLFIASFYLAVILHVFFHELGHFICAKFRGWRFVSFMLFGFVLTRKGNRFAVSRYKVPGALGQCLMEPPPANGDTGLGIALYNAGGIIMNFLLLLLALFVFVFCRDTLPDYVVLLVIPVFLVGAFIIFVNAIPLEVSGIPNDGKNIISLKRDKFSTKAFISSMRVVAALQKGKRVGEFMDRYITDGESIDFSNSVHVMALGIDYSRALDLRDFEKAQKLMYEIKSHSTSLPKIYRLDFGMENVFLALVFGKYNGDIEMLLDDEIRKYMEGAASLRPSGLRVRYALALLYDNDEVEAEKLYDEFIKLCSEYYLPGEASSEKDLLDSLTATV